MLIGAHIAMLAIDTIDDLDITRNFTLDAFISLALHFAFLVELFTTNLDVFYGTTDQFDLLVLGQLLINECVVLSRNQALSLSLTTGLKLLLAQAIIHGLLLFQEILRLTLVHFISTKS